MLICRNAEGDMVRERLGTLGIVEHIIWVDLSSQLECTKI